MKMYNIKRFFKGIYERINNQILVIRFPFLRAYNRYSGKSNTDWDREATINRLKSIEVDEVSIKIVKESEVDHKTNIKYLPFATYVGGIRHEVKNVEYGDDITISYCPKTITVDNKVLFDVDDLLVKGQLIQRCFMETSYETHTFPLTLIVSDDAEINPKFNRFKTYPVFTNKVIQRFRKRQELKYNIIRCIRDLFPHFTELDAMERGWRKKFGIQICKEIKNALKETGGNQMLMDYRIMQIKEKWGELCWYDAYSPESVQKVIRKYENISSKTCIICGKDATHTSVGWISPFCEKHAPENSITFEEHNKRLEEMP